MKLKITLIYYVGGGGTFRWVDPDDVINGWSHLAELFFSQIGHCAALNAILPAETPTSYFISTAVKPVLGTPTPVIQATVTFSGTFRGEDSLPARASIIFSAMSYTEGADPYTVDVKGQLIPFDLAGNRDHIYPYDVVIEQTGDSYVPGPG